MKATSPELFSPSAQKLMLVLMILLPSSLPELVMMASFLGFGPVKTPSVVKSAGRIRRAQRPEHAAASREDALAVDVGLHDIEERKLAAGIVDGGAPEVGAEQLGRHAVDEDRRRIGVVRGDRAAGAGEQPAAAVVELPGEGDLAAVVELGIETERGEPSCGGGDRHP
jgi:hypothetical protein